MKPILFKVTESDDVSFHVQENRQGHQYDKLHYHPEYQISLIVAGSGTCSIGGFNDEFQPDDIYMIGSNVPHVFDDDAHIISVFFRDRTLGDYFLRLPEMAAIRQFLEEASQSFKLQGALAARLKSYIFELPKLTGASRIIHLLEILNQMTLSAEKRMISQATAHDAYSYTAIYRRMKKVFGYLADNFDQPISLDDAASSVHLSRYAFSRYFKKITNKSFVNYLNELRVRAACRFLLRTDYTITQISYLCGFNTLSNFNRQFKKLMRCTPSEYRSQEA